MKNAGVAPEIADPYAALEQILKVIGRSWLSEEWRLEDIRLLAQDTLDKRGRKTGGKRAVIPVQSSIHFETKVRTRTAKLDDRLRP